MVLFFTFLETLHHLITEHSGSTERVGNGADKAFDGIESTYYHSYGASTDGSFWIKATFGKRVFITAVEFVNRLDLVDTQWEHRSYNIDLKTVLYQGGQTIESTFGNTGGWDGAPTSPCLTSHRLTAGLSAQSVL